MLQSFLRGCSLLLISVAASFGQNNDVIPSSRLRPADASRFHPELVRLHDGDIDEIRWILGNELNRKDLALAVSKQLLRKLPMDGNYFAKFLNSSSEVVQEWTLRTMGGYPGDKSAAIPALLNIITDPRQNDAHRALAIRVLGATRMAPDTVSILVHQLPQASTDLRVILLEVIATSGRAGLSLIRELQQYLNAPDGSVQFHAFCAIRKIEEGSGGSRRHAELGEHYATARRLTDAGTSTSDTNLAVHVLRQSSVPKYLTCVALLDLAVQSNHPESTEVVFRKVGDTDRFISQLAANILPRLGSQSAAALAEALSSANPKVRLHAAQQIQELGSRAAPATDALIAALRRAGSEGGGAREVGAYLDVLRGIGTNAHRASDLLVQLLGEQSPIYRNAEKHELHRLRGFIFATLAETGVPKIAFPFVISALANSDPRSSVEFAGAARAAAALGAPARECAPHLLRAIIERLDQDFISFDTFDSHGATKGEYTTCQVEALRALRRIGAADESIAPALRAFLEQSLPALDGTNLFRRIPNLHAEATRTLAALEVHDAQKK